MKKIIITVIIVFLFWCLLFSDGTVRQQPPGWLLDNSRFSMDNSVSFSYSSYYGSLSSLYNNYFSYKVSPQLKIIGNIGYFNTGYSVNSLGGMLQGVGFEYKPNPSMLFHFQYQGITPLKKVGSKESK
jgi:hypothetical protein